MVKKDKEIRNLKEVNLSDKLVNKLSTDFIDTDSEHNLDVATSIGLVYSLERFNESQFVKKRLLKPMTFLARTNKVQKKNMEALMTNNLNVNGLSRKQWFKIINGFTKGLSRYEVKDDSRISRLLRRN